MNNEFLSLVEICNEPRVAFADAMHDTTLKDSCELRWRQNACRKLDLNDMLSRGRLSALTPNFEIEKQSIPPLRKKKKILVYRLRLLINASRHHSHFTGLSMP